MAFNLIEAVGSQFMQKGLLQKISGSLGEDPQATTKALPGTIAAVAAGVVDQGGNEAGAHRLLSKLNEGGFTGPDAPSRAVDSGGVGEGLLDEEERGKGMLSGIFGNKLGAVTEGITRFGGMRNPGSATRLLSLAAPMLMGVLGRQVRDQRMGSSGLMQLLNGQRNNIAAALPAGLGGILGFGGARHVVPEVIEPHREVSQVREAGPVREAHTVRETTPRQTYNRQPERKKSIAGWAVPLALLALVVLAWGALRGRRNERARAPQVTRTTTQPDQNRVAQPAPATQPTPPATGGAGTVGNEGTGGSGTQPVGSANVAQDAGTGGSGAVESSSMAQDAGTGGSGAVENSSMAQDAGTGGSGAVGSESSNMAQDAGTGGSGAVGSESSNMAQDAGTGGSGMAQDAGTGGSGTQEGEATGGSGQEKMRVSDPSSLREAIESPSAAQGFVLEGVEFRTGSSQITSKSKSMVDELGNVLKQQTGTRVRIKGYTDSTGNADANRQLSETRAESVRRELVRDGIPQDRIEVSGEGDADPIASNDTPQGRVQNRRIEVQVLGQ
ncbi:OmpA family protein [Corallococcus exercitus]|uniref:OmpA family protein n=1 Tax=Corallococcus exercitus TaxID=2316736 RepID=A0A7Y4KKT9_9BACT|nr:OmpA family protein [Corallococcus exercitus]NOK34579.1 OmpA family protein [Corallococcus exercitus]